MCILLIITSVECELDVGVVDSTERLVAMIALSQKGAIRGVTHVFYQLRLTFADIVVADLQSRFITILLEFITFFLLLGGLRLQFILSVIELKCLMIIDHIFQLGS